MRAESFTDRMPFARTCWVLLALMWLSAGLGASAIRLMMADDDRADLTTALFVLCAPLSVLLWFAVGLTARFRQQAHPFGRWIVEVFARPRALAAAAAIAAAGFVVPRSFVESTSWVAWAVDALLIAAASLAITGLVALVFRRATPSDTSALSPD